MLWFGLVNIQRLVPTGECIRLSTRWYCDYQNSFLQPLRPTKRVVFLSLNVVIIHSLMSEIRRLDRGLKTQEVCVVPGYNHRIRMNLSSLSLFTRNCFLTYKWRLIFFRTNEGWNQFTDKNEFRSFSESSPHAFTQQKWKGIILRPPWYSPNFTCCKGGVNVRVVITDRCSCRIPFPSWPKKRNVVPGNWTSLFYSNISY